MLYRSEDQIPRAVLELDTVAQTPHPSVPLRGDGMWEHENLQRLRGQLACLRASRMPHTSTQTSANTHTHTPTHPHTQQHCLQLADQKCFEMEWFWNTEKENITKQTTHKRKAVGSTWCERAAGPPGKNQHLSKQEGYKNRIYYVTISSLPLRGWLALCEPAGCGGQRAHNMSPGGCHTPRGR